MDLRQQKLTGEEWDSLERPLAKQEKRILQLIYEGYNNVNVTFNDTLSLINFIKITDNLDMYHEYLFERYFRKSYTKIVKKYCPSLDGTRGAKKPPTLKKRDAIRMANVDSKIKEMKKSIFEFILLKLVRSLLKYGQ